MLEEYKTVIQAEVSATLLELDLVALEKAKNLIIACSRQGGRVHVTGIGKPSYVAKYTASLFSSTGTPSYFLDGTEAVHGSSGQVKAGDVVIAISNSGETKELVATVVTLKKNQGKIISVSRNLNSQLSQLADVALCARVEKEGDPLNKPPRASVISELISLQALSILLQEAVQLTPQTYVKWHPGGAIGHSILEK